MPAHRLNRVAPVLLAGALLSTACGSPTAPTARAANPTMTLGTIGASQPPLAAQVPGQSWQDFAARGWACRPVPSAPGLTQCSHPHQGFPSLDPEAHRPPTFTFLLWNGEEFLGQVLLIRSDLYQGQTCRATGDPYRLIGAVGYNECLHPAGH